MKKYIIFCFTKNIMRLAIDKCASHIVRSIFNILMLLCFRCRQILHSYHTAFFQKYKIPKQISTLCIISAFAARVSAL